MAALVETGTLFVLTAAVVFEAVQESLGRHVALKILPLHGRINQTQMDRFRLEARSAART